MDFLTALACIQLEGGLDPSQVGIGTPASSSAAGSGYVDPGVVTAALDCLTKGTGCGSFKPGRDLPGPARRDDLVDQLGRLQRQQLVGQGRAARGRHVLTVCSERPQAAPAVGDFRASRATGSAVNRTRSDSGRRGGTAAGCCGVPHRPVRAMPPDLRWSGGFAGRDRDRGPSPPASRNLCGVMAPPHHDAVPPPPYGLGSLQSGRLRSTLFPAAMQLVRVWVC